MQCKIRKFVAQVNALASLAVDSAPEVEYGHKRFLNYYATFKIQKEVHRKFAIGVSSRPNYAQNSQKHDRKRNKQMYYQNALNAKKGPNQICSRVVVTANNIARQLLANFQCGLDRNGTNLGDGVASISTSIVRMKFPQFQLLTGNLVRESRS